MPFKNFLILDMLLRTRAATLSLGLDNMNNNNLVMASQQLLSEEFGKGRTTIYKSY